MRPLLSLLPALPAILALAASPQAPFNTTDSNGNPPPLYSPARPPSIPLAVRSPYTSAWSSTAGLASLNSGSVQFWTGDPLGWEGIVVVDGVAYEYLGAGSSLLPTLPNLRSAVPQTVLYDSQSSNFTFLAGSVSVHASFVSPVTPGDICRSSIPLSYLTVAIESLDGKPHDVRFYSDVNAQWVAGTDGGSTVTWDMHQSNGSAAAGRDALYSWVVALQSPILFAENGDFARWGNFTYTTTPAAARGNGNGSTAFGFQSGYSASVRYAYVTTGNLSGQIDPSFRGAGVQEPVFAFAHAVGRVTHASVRYTIGTLQDPVMQYLYPGGVAPLAPWWARCYGDVWDVVRFHWDDLAAVTALGGEFEEKLKGDVEGYYQDNLALVPPPCNASAPPYENKTRGEDREDGSGEPYVFDPDSAYGYLDPANWTGVPVPDTSEPANYYAIVALSARQVLHAYVYAVPPPAFGCTGATTTPAPLMFQKEISSDGNVNTVDVLYPATPFFLWANPRMLRYTLEPLLQNQEGRFYPNGYSMHDLGSSFPNATGHVDGNDEYMPVEESGNFILMAFAYYRFSGDAGWLARHYTLLRQFAEYLVAFSLVPAAQLSTDDFAGRLVNQTNLAVKGMVGLQAMAHAAAVVARAADNVSAYQADAAYFGGVAKSYYTTWLSLGIDPSGTHALLAYQWRSSWGLLYNVFPDKLLGLGLIDDGVYAMQSAFYPSVSQVFGVPLDSRHHYTKSDWMLWAAATCAPETRRLFVNALAYWLNHTSAEFPFGDLFETVGTGGYPAVPDTIFFKARPVVGGHFSLLAMYRAEQLAEKNETVVPRQKDADMAFGM